MAVTVANAQINVTAPFDVNDFRRRLGARLRTAASGIGSVAGAALITALGASAVAGLGQFTAALVAALAPAVGALGILPAVGLAAALAIGTLKLALSGMGDALKAGMSGDTAKFNEALKGMAPAAQTAARALVSLKPALDDLRRTVQQNFWQPWAGQVRALATQYLPLLKAALGDIAAMMGGAGAGLTAYFGSPEAFERIRTALANVVAALQPLIAGLPDLARAFVPLLEVGSSFLPSLTNGFESLTKSFADFMERAAGDGSLQKWISDGLSTLGDLMTTLRDTGGLISTVFSGMAQGGGSVLTVIGDLAAQLTAFFRTAEGASVLNALGASLQIIGNIIGELIIAAGPGLGALLQGLVAGLTALAPAAGPVGTALGAIMQAAAPLLPMLGTLLAGALTVLAGILQAVLPFVEPLVAAFSGLATAVVPQLTAAFSAMVANGLPQLIPLATSLMNAIMPLVPVIAELAIMFISQLLPPILQLQTQLVGALLPVLLEVAGVVAGALLQAFVQLQPHMPALIQAGVTLVSTLGQLLVQFAPLIGILAQAAAGLLVAFVQSGALQGGIQVLTFVIQAVAGVLIMANGAVNMLKGAFNSAQAAAGALGGALSGALSGALNTLRGAVGSVQGIFSGAGGWLVSAGRNIISGLIDGIQGMIGSLKSTLGSITGLIPSWKGPAAVDRRLLEPSGRMIMQGLRRGIGLEVPALERQLGELTRRIGAPPAGATGGYDRGSGAPTYHFAPGSIVLDASKLRSIADLVRMVEGVRMTARQHGAGRTA